MNIKNTIGFKTATQQKAKPAMPASKDKTKEEKTDEMLLLNTVNRNEYCYAATVEEEFNMLMFIMLKEYPSAPMEVKVKMLKDYTTKAITNHKLKNI